MTIKSTALVLSVCLLAPLPALAQAHGNDEAHGKAGRSAKPSGHDKEPAHGKDAKRTSGDHKTPGDHAKPKRGAHDEAEPRGKARAAADATHEAPAPGGKGAARGNEHKEPTAKHTGSGDRDAHGPSAKRRERPGHEDKLEPKTRARMLETSSVEGHDADGAHKAAAEPTRRARPASRGELHAITEDIRRKIGGLSRVPHRPGGRLTAAAPAAVRPEPKASLVWRSAVSWPPALDTGAPHTFAAGDNVQLTWESESRCTPAEPELPTARYSTVAGLAPSRCCGLFQPR